MTMFSVNATRIDPYKNFRFRMLFGGVAVAGVSKVSGLKRTIEPVQHRDGGDLSTKRLSPGLATFEPITIERGISHDDAFEAWALSVYNPEGAGLVSLANFRRVAAARGSSAREQENHRQLFHFTVPLRIGGFSQR